MKQIYHLFKQIILVIILFGGCTGKYGPGSKTYMDSLQTTFLAMKGESDSAWTYMISEDDQKLFYLKRLLQEVSYTNQYDTAVYARLMQQLGSLKSARYDQVTMENSSLIDRYDSLTIMLVDEVVSFARSHPDYKDYPLMEELVNGITEFENNVIYHRVNYDTQTKVFNSFIKDNKKYLLKIFGESVLKERSLFELPV